MASKDNRSFTSYLRSLELRGVKEKTLISYASGYRSLVQKHGLPPEINDITGYILRKIKEQMLLRKSEATTINHRLIIIKNFARWADQIERLNPNQLDSILSVREIPLAPLGAKAPTPGDLERLITFVEQTGSIRDQSIFQLLLSGLRLSEVVGLEQEDININAHRGSVHIRGPHVKGSASRTVPLNRTCRHILLRHLSTVHEGHALFDGERGRFSEAGIYRLVKNYGRAVGIGMSPHTLRHAFAIRYLAANVGDLAGLKILLGHSDISITSRHYARLSFEDLSTNIEKINF